MVVEPVQRTAPVRRHSTTTIAQRLDVGARIAAFFADNPGLHTRPWRRIAEEVFRCKPTAALAKRHERAYTQWLEHSDSGRLTALAAGAETRTQRRRKTHEPTAPGRHKGESMGYELLQWWVDNCEALKARADSALMLAEAQRLRADLMGQGVLASQLPQINKGWLHRWRLRHDMALRRGTVKFQISWAKTVARVRCMLGNIFRLRHFWALCHPGVPMRWLSADQKPSWMNNASRGRMYARKGARACGAKENHAASRDRYTIFTFVQSWPLAAGSPPPVAVLFKAASGVRIAQALEHPPWMKLQFQERGSYRAEDVVEALTWALKPATCPQESVVILLDWFSAHLSEEVQEAIRAMGHVVLYHGGGVTGLEQVNDTHMHAQVQRTMEQLEVKLMSSARRASPEKIASLRRQDVLDLVSEMWLGLDHEGISRVGYAQTGPCLPADGGAEDIFKDLRPVWEAIDGEALRDQAIRQVDEMWADGIIASWADVDAIIEQQAPHAAEPEGLEGAEWEVTQPSDDERDDDDDDLGDDNHGDDAGQGVLSGGVALAEGVASAAGGPASAASGSVASAPASAACTDGVVAAAAPVAQADSRDTVDLDDESAYLKSLRHVVAVCQKRRHDALLRPVLKELRRTSIKRSATAAPEAQKLRAQAAAAQEQVIAERAKRRALERDAKLDDLSAQTALEEAKEKAATARREAILASAAERQETLRLQEETLRARRVDEWLQTEYPVALARSLLAWRKGLALDAAQALETAVKDLSSTSRSARYTPVPALWRNDLRLSSRCSYTCLPGQGSKRSPVRCNREFEWILFGQGLAVESSHTDAAAALASLINSICPKGSILFNRRYTLNHLLEKSDCVASQAFVHAIILLSKWLGPSRFPKGVYGWPPQPPAGLAPVAALPPQPPAGLAPVAN